MPRSITIDFFGKINVGKSTIFHLFVDTQKRFMEEGGNLLYDQRTYFARCWVFPRRWEHAMVFLCDPKYEFRWNSLDFKYLKKTLEPTNILIIVSDSTQSDAEAIKQSLSLWPRIKRNLVIFLIANMQDKPGALSVEEMKRITGIEDAIGLVAIAPDARSKVEPFLEIAVKRYFMFISLRDKQITPLEGDAIPEEKHEGKISRKLAERMAKRKQCQDQESPAEKETNIEPEKTPQTNDEKKDESH